MFFLAQTLETAKEGVSLLKTISDGGTPLVALVLAALATAAFVWQLRRNNTIEKEWRDAGKADADKRLSEQKDLMREMLARDKDATTATTASMQVVEGFSATMKEQGAETRRKLDELFTRLGDVERAVRKQ